MIASDRSAENWRTAANSWDRPADFARREAAPEMTWELRLRPACVFIASSTSRIAQQRLSRQDWQGRINEEIPARARGEQARHHAQGRHSARGALFLVLYGITALIEWRFTRWAYRGSLAI